tara:strand:+ start:635 stop:784 length:150 start_codon:yes stop_codon:yes gene_type:complete
MEALNYISILILIFLIVSFGKQIKLEKDVRKLKRLSKHIKSEIDKLKKI